MNTKIETALVAILLFSAISCTKDKSEQHFNNSNPSFLAIAGKAGKALALNVNASAAAGGNGSSTAPFQTIEDALAAARGAVATEANLAWFVDIVRGLVYELIYVMFSF